MKSFPPLRMICTSDKIQGQVYIPAVNWVLMIITIIVVGVFSNLQNLTNAYGFSVSSVMLSTSILLGISMYYVKHLNWIFAVGFVCIFGFFDGKRESLSTKQFHKSLPALFWGAALKKVPHGGWVPLMIGIIL